MTPRVAVIIPCYNERRTIARVLQAVHDQSIPLEEMEVIVADGMSDDGTRDIVAEFARAHPRLDLRLVDNRQRSIPAALNRAIESTKSAVVLRIDAHSLPYPDYIERSLRALERTGAANAGGLWEIRPANEGWIARSIAAAAAHPLGAGDARYRTAGQEGEADTVPFGAFRREWLDRVGLFDESLLSNEDYELNARLRRAGGRIWLDPSIRSVYFARPDLRALARQYLRYGFWKSRMLVRNLETLRWRQALPPLFVLAALGLAVAGLVWSPAWPVLGVQWVAYASVTLAAGFGVAITRRDPALILGFPPAVWTMHLTWGAAFLWGMITWLVGGRLDPRRA
jgi:cellulose synthase/poly-beta-1,6-N-acetylglucosamine synthase-like glycosyltransferase